MRERPVASDQLRGPPLSKWAEYDRALAQRGDITLRISEETIEGWKPASPGTRENTLFGYKSIIGDLLRASHPESQEAEALIACNILNRIFELGRPKSFAMKQPTR